MRSKGTGNHMFSKARLDTLSDGIFCVAMTLLILDVRLPDDFHPRDAGELLQGLADLWPKFLPYVLSFGVLGLRWLSNIEIRTRAEYVRREFSRARLNRQCGFAGYGIGSASTARCRKAVKTPPSTRGDPGARYAAVSQVGALDPVRVGGIDLSRRQRVGDQDVPALRAGPHDISETQKSPGRCRGFDLRGAGRNQYLATAGPAQSKR
jgi:hypothetical protein